MFVEWLWYCTRLTTRITRGVRSDTLSRESNGCIPIDEGLGFLIAGLALG